MVKKEIDTKVSMTLITPKVNGTQVLPFELKIK